VSAPESGGREELRRILCQQRIDGYELQVMLDGLPNQKPIKRVAVMRRQPRQVCDSLLLLTLRT
jgi:hypothetical protein